MIQALSAYGEGQGLPDVVFPALTRHLFALYCGASGDHNPLHTDIDHARVAGGLPDVIGQGMLSMALAARLVTDLIRPDQLENYAVRFVSMTRVGDVLTCSGSIGERWQSAKGTHLKIVMRMTTADGRIILTGTAAILVG